MSDSESQQNNSCSMVGLLSILVQVALGALSFSVLIIKRYRQKPKRPWKIWAFDTSKQIISQLIAHFINLTITLALSYNRQNSDECLWYFITNIFDNTMGVLICILLLKLIEGDLQKRRKIHLISGNYYKKLYSDQISRLKQLNLDQIINLDQKQFNIIHEHNSKKQSFISDDDSRVKVQKVNNQLKQQKNCQQKENSQVIYFINYKAWIIQLCIWNGVVILAKCALFGLEFSLQKQLQEFSIFILGWIQKYPVFELLLVIVVVPVIMNGFAYWVQDNFLMKRDKKLEEKNLLQQNQKENNKNQNVIGEQSQMNRQQNQIQLKSRTIKKSIDQSYHDHIQLEEDIDSKDYESQQQKIQDFEQFDKFNKFNL